MGKENKKDNRDYNNHSCHLLSTYYMPLVYSEADIISIFSPSFWMKKLKLREVSNELWGHTARKWQSLCEIDQTFFQSQFFSSM